MPPCKSCTFSHFGEQQSLNPPPPPPPSHKMKAAWKRQRRRRGVSVRFPCPSCLHNLCPRQRVTELPSCQTAINAAGEKRSIILTSFQLHALNKRINIFSQRREEKKTKKERAWDCCMHSNSSTLSSLLKFKVKLCKSLKPDAIILSMGQHLSSKVSCHINKKKCFYYR